MAIRKNKKRIDPRYFLNETTYRDLEENIDLLNESPADLVKVATQLGMIRSPEGEPLTVYMHQDTPQLLAKGENSVGFLQRRDGQFEPTKYGSTVPLASTALGEFGLDTTNPMTIQRTAKDAVSKFLVATLK